MLLIILILVGYHQNAIGNENIDFTYNPVFEVLDCCDSEKDKKCCENICTCFCCTNLPADFNIITININSNSEISILNFNQKFNSNHFQNHWQPPKY